MHEKKWISCSEQINIKKSERIFFMIKYSLTAQFMMMKKSDVF